jgi:ClpP class serine protease
MLRMFLRTELADRIGRLYASGRIPSTRELADFRAARTERVRLASRMEGARSGANEPENYAVVGNVAYIAIEGVLSEEPDFWSWLLGLDGTTYADIRAAFALAGGNPEVSKVQLLVGSPGGYIDGLFETLATIESFAKPMTVHAVQACSAAYSLAAMAGPIRASGPAAEFGSVGVAITYYVDPERVDIASTEAPNKRPDVRTEEGKAIVRAELDALHDLFVDAIARGRQHASGAKFDAARVNAEFGRGGVLLTAQAKAAGMIDTAAKPVKRGTSALHGESSTSSAARIERLVLAARADEDDAPEPAASPAATTPAAPAGGANQRPTEGTVAPPIQPPPAATAPGQGTRTNMTKEELKAQFPAVYSAIHDEGKAEGVAGEQKRSRALLKSVKGEVGKMTGEIRVALDAIESGKSLLDEEVQADFMNARRSAETQGSRQADSDTAGAVLGDAGSGGKIGGDAGKDFGDAVAAAYEKNFPSAKKGG